MRAKVCPHFKPESNEERREIEDLFSRVAAHRRQHKGMFEATHTIMTLYDDLRGGDVSESAILEDITTPRSGNHCTVIKGDTGTGKSELCSYISIELEKKGLKPLYLERSADLVRILTEDLLDYYENRVGRPIEFEEAVKKLGQYLANPGVAAMFGSSGMIMQLEISETQIGADDLKDINKFVSSKLRQIVAKESETEVDVFSAEEIQRHPQVIWGQVFMDKLEGDWMEVANQMNEIFWRQFYAKADAPNLKELIDKISDDIPDERLYIIFEDYAFSRWDNRKLMDYIQDDDPKNKCEFVIAGLPDRVGMLEATTPTAAERFRAYWTHRKDQPVPFLTDKNHLDFIHPYLAYLKVKDRSLSGTGKRTLDETQHSEKGRCSRCRRCEPSFIPMFPLNDEFCDKIYFGLVEKKPREYVSTVFRVLKDYFDSAVLPSDSEELLDLKVKPLGIVIGDDRLRDFFYWYGEIKDDRVEIPYAFAQSLGYPIPKSHVVRDRIVLKLKGGPIMFDKGEDQRADALEEEYSGLAQWVQAWRNNPIADDDRMVTDIYIRQGIKGILDRMTDGFAVESGSPIKVFMGKTDSPIVYTDTEPTAGQITVDQTAISLEQAQTLLRFGFFSEKDAARADTNEVLDRCGMLLADWTEQWRSRTMEYLMNYRFSKPEDSGLRLEEIVQLGYEVLLLLENPWTHFSAPDFERRLGEGKREFAFSEEVLEVFDVREQASINTLQGYGAQISEMFRWLFRLSGDILDPQKLRASEDFSKSLDEITRKVKRKSITDLGKSRVVFQDGSEYGDVEFRVDGAKLKDVVLYTWHCSRALRKVYSDPDEKDRMGQKIHEFLDAYLDVPFSDLIEKLTTLNSIGAIVEQPIYSWANAVITAGTDSTYDEAISRCVRIRDMLRKEETTDFLEVIPLLAWSKLRKDSLFDNLGKIRSHIADAKGTMKIDEEVKQLAERIIEMLED